MFAVSVDPPEASLRLQKRLESRFTFLSDPEGVLLDAIGVRHHAGRNDGVDIAYPTAMLVDAEGVVRWIHQSETYRDRSSPDEIFDAIDDMRSAGDRAALSPPALRRTGTGSG